MKHFTGEYTVRMHTPAFLGNAEQSGQWRTPPFKAQLRQWWRVAYAASKQFRPDVAAMRDAEGKLFGHAWLDNDRDEQGEKTAGRKSLVRIRLGQWGRGKLKSWDGLEQGTVYHPEAKKSNFNVGPHAYLAYGPLDGRGGTKFSEKANAALQANEHSSFSLACPEPHAALVQQALALMDRFGAVGGRSRNGWGSYALQPVDGPASTCSLPLRDWKGCLQLDWPHAIGQDQKGALIWHTQPQGDWKALMKELALIKIGLRTQFIFTSGNNAPAPETRHWLSHPVTKHNVGAWGQARLPNSLRFKVRPAPNDPQKLVGVIFHMPCLPPAAFSPKQDAIIQTWQSVHTLLDELVNPATVRAYGSIADRERRAGLKPQLDTVTLSRISE